MGRSNALTPFSFSGTVGNVVGYIVKGKDYYRQKPSKPYYRGTKKQLLQQNRFVSCVKLAKTAMDDINQQIWKNYPIKMPGHGLFVHTNYKCFDKTGKIISYENLKFSIGKIILPGRLEFEKNEADNGSITLKWDHDPEDEEAVPTDQLRIIALCEKKLSIIKGLAATRNDRLATFQLPIGIGDTVHLYAYFVNEAHLKGSDTYYQMLKITGNNTLWKFINNLIYRLCEIVPALRHQVTKILRRVSANPKKLLFLHFVITLLYCLFS
jgi:hypothetical protein